MQIGFRGIPALVAVALLVPAQAGRAADAAPEPIPVFLGLEVLATPGRAPQTRPEVPLAALADALEAGARVRVQERFKLDGELLGFVAGEDPRRELRQRALRGGARYVVLVGLTRIAGRSSFDIEILPVGSGPRLARASADDAVEAGLLAAEQVAALARRHATLHAQALDPPPAFGPEATQGVPPPQARSLRLVEIRVEGNRRVDADAVRAVLRSKVGEELDPRKVASDIRRIYELGFFRDVQVVTSDLRGGQLLVFQVDENPVIRRVTIVGNENMGSDDITEQLTITIGSTVDYPLIIENRARIESMYQAQGYYLVEVEYAIEALGPDAVSVDFDVTEGRKLRLQQVIFHGNDTLEDDVLMRGLNTKPWGFLSPVSHFWDHSGLYAEPLFFQDLDTITRRYMDEGFIRVKVAEPNVQVEPDGLYVIVEIEEGPQYSVGLVDVLGDDVLETQTLIDTIELTPGSIFSRTLLSDDVESLRRSYADRGYYDARVRPRTDVDPDALTVDVIFEVEKGQLFFLDYIQVSGNTRTRDEVVRRELSLAEGELYSDGALERSRARVQRLGYFEEVSFEAEQVDEQTVGVTIDVVERPTGAFSFGAGFGSTDGFLLNASIRQDNLFGRGWSTTVSADLGTQNSFGSLRFMNPAFLGSPAGVGTALSYSDREFIDFDQTVLGFSVDLSYPLDEGETRVSTGYAFSGREVSGFSQFQAASLLQREEFQDDTTTSMMTLAIRRDTRDDLRFPKTGYVTGAAAEFAGLGGVSKFLRLESRATRFWQSEKWTGFDSTFIVNSRAGYVFDLNSISDFDLPDCGSTPIPDCGSINAEVDEISRIDDDLKLSITERYFLGGVGAFQVRGFEQRSLGPRRSILRPVQVGSSTHVYTASGRAGIGEAGFAPGECRAGPGLCNSINDTDDDDFADLNVTDVIGGNKMFLLNLELQFPISEELGLVGAMFFDMGNAFSENENMNPADFRFGTGVAAHWFSPFGPIMVTLGFPLDALEDEDGSVFEFSLGGQQF